MKALWLSFVKRIMKILTSVFLICFTTLGFVRSETLHTSYDALLQEQVTAEGMVNYKALTRSPETLNAYLEQLSKVTPAAYKSWDQERQLAFLINLYNAATLKLIVDHYPVKSIKDIGGWIKGPWKQEVVPYLGQTITLNHLEHEIIRKEFTKVPEIHFALVCAAMGCPPLRPEAYTGEKLNAQLADQKKIFLANAEKNRRDAKQKRLYISPIFKWYGEDFEAASGSVQAYLSSAWPEVNQDWDIQYTSYDWSLNKHD